MMFVVLISYMINSGFVEGCFYIMIAIWDGQKKVKGYIFINFLRCIKGSTRLPFIHSTCRLPWLCWSLVFETEQHMTLHEKLCCWKLSRRTQRAHAYTIHICNMCSVHITWRKNRCVSKRYSISRYFFDLMWLESFPTAQPQRQPSPDDMMAICQCELQSRIFMEESWNWWPSWYCMYKTTKKDVAWSCGIALFFSYQIII